MTCCAACQATNPRHSVGFGGSSFPPLGSLNCLVSGSWHIYAPGSKPPTGSTVCYMSDGTQWRNYNPNAAPWNQLPVVTVSLSAFNRLFSNFTQKASVAWRQQSLQGSLLNAQAVGTTLVNLSITAGGSKSIFQYTGPATYAACTGSTAGLAWALSKGYLIIPKTYAAIIQSNDQSSGVIPASFWEMYGKPIVAMAAIVGGAAAIGGASAAGSGAAAGSSGAALAPTTAPVYTAAQSAAIGSAEAGLPTISTGISTLGTVGTVAGGSSFLSTAGTVAGIAGTTVKGAATLLGVKSTLAASNRPALGSTTPGFAPTASKISGSTLLLLLGGGAALFFLH